MKKFTIIVEETLSRHVEVEAVDENHAEELVQAQYDDGEIVLDADDCNDVVIKEINCW